MEETCSTDLCDARLGAERSVQWWQSKSVAPMAALAIVVLLGVVDGGVRAVLLLLLTRPCLPRTLTSGCWNSVRLACASI